VIQSLLTWVAEVVRRCMVGKVKRERQTWYSAFWLPLRIDDMHLSRRHRTASWQIIGGECVVDHLFPAFAVLLGSEATSFKLAKPRFFISSGAIRFLCRYAINDLDGWNSLSPLICSIRCHSLPLPCLKCAATFVISFTIAIWLCGGTSSSMDEGATRHPRRERQKKRVVMVV
jgi:hypothetical protein